MFGCEWWEGAQNSFLSFLLQNRHFAPGNNSKHHKLVGLSVELIVVAHRRHPEQLEIKQS
jgi:hypothetical protein